MTAKPLLLTLLLAIVPAEAKPFGPFDVVSVCPFKVGTRDWAVTWHNAMDGKDETSTRVFRYLQGPDVDACLTLMVEVDAATLELVEAFAKNPTHESSAKANEAVRRRWTLYGVDRAITEVATTGRRGEQVARMLRACETIRTPQIGGTAVGNQE